MTVANQTNRISAVGNAAIGQEVPFTFPYAATSDIKVYSRVTATGVEALLAETTNYTLTAANDTGGTLTTVIAVAATSEIHIIRDTPKTQALDLEAGGSFSAEDIEDAIDKNTKLIIENYDAIKRCVRAPVTDAVALDMELPDSVTRASENSGYDASGNVTTTESDGTFAVATGIYDDIITKSPWLDVRAYGATGDGTTDDTAAIQLAVDALSSGGRLYFPAGSYKLTSAITINTNSLWLQGVGDATIFKFPATSNFKMFTIASTGNVTNIKITDMMFDGNSAAQGAGNNYFIIQEGTTYTLKHFEFTGLYCKDLLNNGNPILLQNSSYGVISNNRFDITAGVAVAADCSYVTVSNNTFYNGTDTQIGLIGTGAATTQPTYITITGNAIDTTTAGQGIEVLTGRYISIANNVIRNVYANGIFIWDGGIGVGAHSQDITISGNTITECSRGIYCLVIDRLSIVGNTCNYNERAGIQYQSGTYGTIEGNNCINNGTAASGEEYGIYIASATNTNVIGNNCSDDGPATQTYGINYFGAGIAGAVVMGNHLNGNTSGGYRFENGVSNNFATLNYVDGVLQYDDRSQATPAIDTTIQHMRGFAATANIISYEDTTVFYENELVTL